MTDTLKKTENDAAAAGSQENWDESQLRDLVEKATRKGQNIQLPHGLSTGGADRSGTANIIFPKELTGKSVLDIGSFTGYFCFEALKRGAKSATGIEVDDERIEQARLVADILKVDAEFRQSDIEREPIEGKFDYVLCLNVLHHMKNPISVIDTLIGVTRERLIFEVATLGQHDRPKLGISPLAGLFLRRIPIIVVGGHRKGKKKVIQKFFITPLAMRNLLEEHRKVFAKVEIIPSEYKDRFIVIAHKRQIKRMVVVAGPTSAGKSTLVEKLLNAQVPEVSDKVDFGEPKSWTSIGARTLKKMTEPKIDKLLYHYDFLRPQFKPYEYDDSLDVLDCAEDVTYVTIWTPPAVLKAQLEKGEVAPMTKNGVFQGNKFKKQLRKMYEDPIAVCKMYRNWLSFCRKKPGKHLVVTFHEGVKFYTIDEWETQVAAPLEAAAKAAAQATATTK